MLEKARKLVERLSFDECVRTFNELPPGNPVIDILFDRMEELDAERFEEFLG